MPKFVIEGQSHGRLAKLAISAGSLLALVRLAAAELRALLLKRAESRLAGACACQPRAAAIHRRRRPPSR